MRSAKSTHASQCFFWTRMAALLLANNAHVNARDGRFRATPLHLALSKSYEDLVELLLSHGADAEAEDIHGVTPFYFAKAKGYEYALRLMRKYDGGE
jgi:ankyrin repeat protein